MTKVQNQTASTKNGASIAKTILREMDFSGEPWAVSMELFFNVSAHLYEIGDMEADVNSDWGYHPGAMGNTIDYGYPAYTELSEMTNVQLLEAGNYLHRLTGILQSLELAY